LNKYRNKIEEYLKSYKVQLKFAPKYKDTKFITNPELHMNPVYYNLMGKIELAEKLLIELKKQ
jgi:hypothetical protein